MLIIRNDQLNSLIKGSDEEWIEFLLDLIKNEVPELEDVHSDEELRSRIRTGIRRSERYGISAADDQSSFVSLMFRIAPNFDEQEDIKRVLTDERFEPTRRMENLFSLPVPDAAWEEAVKNYDESVWRESTQNHGD